MRLLVSWVRDFVDVTAPADEVADRLALRGFEVASVEALGDGDAVIDFEVTANRPDCLSVLGLAREIGATYGLPVRDPAASVRFDVPAPSAPTGRTGELAVAIHEQELCPRYCAAVAEVDAASTPAWLADRLQAAGIRPISPFVDITNYVLMELGHPMHAFDLDALANRELHVRRAGASERIVTLDGVERSLDAEMLVIADAARAQAVAGVMGGGGSEVSASTRRVAFESAYFKPASVRRTSKRLGLKTEASARFERGTDINAPGLALARAIALMQDIGAGRLVAPVLDLYPEVRGPRTISLRRDRLARVLGLEVPDTDVDRILSALGLHASAIADGWTVRVPTFRVDLLREVDLIEEVGRHFGFENLEPAFPVMVQAAAPPDPRVSRDRLVRQVLASAGLTEAVTFGFIERASAEAFAPDAGPEAIVHVANPLSATFDVLRPSLLPGLIESVAHNRRHGRRDIGLYEIGARFTAAGESRGVGMAWTGHAAEHWSAPPRPVDFFDAKGVAQLLSDVLGFDVVYEPLRLPFLVAGRSAGIVVHGQRIGIIGQIEPAIVERAGAPRQDPIFAAELDLDEIARRQQVMPELVRPLPRHPAVVRDLSIVVSDALPAAIIRGTIQSAGDG
ncbi:MAG: phenylalanine--tRNA ligase subunit beta, partial [Vicinamibacterales bacterium]